MRYVGAAWRGMKGQLRAFFRWTGFGEKKLMDYIQLIVLPFVLIIGGQLVSQAVNASARAQALEQAQENRLKDYLDQMANLALDRGLLSSERDRQRDAVIREVARARTLTALAGMDGARKRFVVTFLYELGLINGVNTLISLHGANLSGAELDGVELFASNLSRARMSDADLSNARLTFALLNEAVLSNADLEGALLVDARLNQADLRLANLTGADASNASMFNADLRGANLRNVNLNNANLRSADLRGADLRGANLTGADLTGAIIGEGNGNEEDGGPVLVTRLDDVTWDGAVCPDRSLATGTPVTCDGHLAIPLLSTPVSENP